MATSATVICALKFQDGVVIAADSQATDLVVGVRWPVEKIERLDNHECILGFSGSLARAQEARCALADANLHDSTFGKMQRLRGQLYKVIGPVYEAIKTSNQNANHQLYKTSLWGLAAARVANQPTILEFGINGDIEEHQSFHAIGSAADTAYAVYRTLGGSQLCCLWEEKATFTVLRVIRTAVNVSAAWVGEPLRVGIVSGRGTRLLGQDELQAHLQSVDQWEKRETAAILSSP